LDGTLARGDQNDKKYCDTKGKQKRRNQMVKLWGVEEKDYYVGKNKVKLV